MDKKKFVLIYEGGSMGDTPEVVKKTNEDWDKWFGMCWSDLVDGGAPFMDKAMMTNGKESMSSDMRASGYSIITAADYDSAMKAAMMNPVVTSGGKVHVFEVMIMTQM